MDQKTHTIMKWAVSFDPRTKAGTHDSKPQGSALFLSELTNRKKEEIERNPTSVNKLRTTKSETRESKMMS